MRLHEFVYVENEMKLKPRLVVLEDKGSSPGPEGPDRFLDTKYSTFQAVKSAFMNVKLLSVPSGSRAIEFPAYFIVANPCGLGDGKNGFECS